MRSFRKNNIVNTKTKSKLKSRRRSPKKIYDSQPKHEKVKHSRKTKDRVSDGRGERKSKRNNRQVLKSRKQRATRLTTSRKKTNQVPKHRNVERNDSRECDDECPSVTPPTPCPPTLIVPCPPCPICSGVPCPPCPACPPCAATSSVAVDTEARYVDKSNVILQETRTEIANVSNLESDSESFNDKDKLLLLLSRIKESDKKVSENIKLLTEIALIFDKTVEISYDSLRYDQVWGKVVSKLKNLFNVTPPPALRLPAPTAITAPSAAPARAPIPVESVKVVDIVPPTTSNSIQEKFNSLCQVIGIEPPVLDSSKYQRTYDSLLAVKHVQPNVDLGLFQKVRDDLKIPSLTDEVILSIFPNPIKKTVPLPEPSLPSFELPINREKTKNELLQEQLDKVSARLEGVIDKLEVTDAMVVTLEEIKKDKTVKNKYFEFFKKIRDEQHIADTKLSDQVILDLFPNEAITIDIQYTVVLPTKIKEGTENEFVGTRKIIDTNINDVLSSLKNNKLETSNDYKDMNTDIEKLEAYRKFYNNVLNSLVTFTEKKITNYKIKTEEEIKALSSVKGNHKTFAQWLYRFLNNNSIIRPIDPPPRTDGTEEAVDPTRQAADNFLAKIRAKPTLNVTAVVVVIEEPSSEKIITSIKYLESLIADLAAKRKPYDTKVNAITGFIKSLNDYNAAIAYYKKTMVSYDSLLQEMQNQVSLIEYYNHESFLYIYSVREILEKRKTLKEKDLIQFLEDNIEVKNQIKNRWEYLQQRDPNTKKKLSAFEFYDITNTSSLYYKFIQDYNNQDNQKHIEILKKKYQNIAPNDSLYLQTLRENLKSSGTVKEKIKNEEGKYTTYIVTLDNLEYSIPTSDKIEFIYSDWNAVGNDGQLLIDDEKIRATLNALTTLPKWRFLKDMLKPDQPLDKEKLQKMARSHAPLHPKAYPIDVGSKLNYFEYVLSDYFDKSIKQEEKYDNMLPTLSVINAKLLSSIQSLMANFLSVEKKNKVETYNHTGIIRNCNDFVSVLSSDDKLVEFFNTPLPPPETS